MRYTRIYSAGISLMLCAILSACSSTKLVEKEDDVKYQPPEHEVGQVKVYDSDTVGTVEDLYGEDSNIEQSEVYKNAIERVPELRYNIIYFDFDSANISEEGKEVLRNHANYLIEESDIFITLEGHADQRGSEGYNLALGEQRATAVRNILVALGVSKSQLGIVSFGEEKPAIYENTDDAYQKNRRVEIIYQ